MDEYGGRNGEPQTLHKYLYCHANPANSIDPSGNMTLNELQTTATALLVLAIKVAVPTFAVLYGYDVLDHILGGSKPTLGQRIQLAEARALLSNSTLPSHLDSKRGIALTANIRVYPEGKLGRWAETRPFGHPFGWNTIKVEETVFKLSPGLLAATLMHESVHTGQWSPIAFPGCSMERSAYQVESDFLRAIGLTGEKYWSPALLSRFPTSEDENWLRDSAMDYDSLGTSNAAVSR